MSDIQTSTFKGARYVPKFDGVWDNTREYEAITCVQHNAFTYLSKKPVPTGVEITNTDFWILWADPNAQMQQLHQDVIDYSNQVGTLTSDMNQAITEINNELADINTELDAKPIAVIIGDSWSDPRDVSSAYGYLWIDSLRKALNIDEDNFYNFAIKGMGFMYGTTNFQIQLQQAISTITDKNQVKYVIVIGGTNDYTHGYNSDSSYVAYSDVIENMQTSINDNFPNANSWFFFMQGARNRTYPISLIDKVIRNCKTANVINTAWPISFADFQNDLHLSQEGYNKFCDFVTKSILGGDYTYACSRELNFKETMADALADTLGVTLSYAHVKAVWNARVIQYYVYVNITAITTPGAVSQYFPLYLNDKTVQESLGIPIYPSGSMFGTLQSINNDNGVSALRQNTVNTLLLQNEVGINTRGENLKTGAYSSYAEMIVYRNQSLA